MQFAFCFCQRLMQLRAAMDIGNHLGRLKPKQIKTFENDTRTLSRTGADGGEHVPKWQVTLFKSQRQ